MTFAQSAADEFKCCTDYRDLYDFGSGDSPVSAARRLAPIYRLARLCNDPSLAVAAPFHLGNLMLSLAFLLAMSLSLAVVIHLLAPDSLVRGPSCRLYRQRYWPVSEPW